MHVFSLSEQEKITNKGSWVRWIYFDWQCQCRWLILNIRSRTTELPFASKYSRFFLCQAKKKKHPSPLIQYLNKFHFGRLWKISMCHQVPFQNRNTHGKVNHFIKKKKKHSIRYIYTQEHENCVSFTKFILIKSDVYTFLLSSLSGSMNRIWQIAITYIRIRNS